MSRRASSFFVALVAAVIASGFGSDCPAQSSGLFGLGSKTLGGGMTWSDEIIFHDYRVQKNAVVGHYRLIDGNDERITFGALDHCLTKLEEIKREKKLPPMPKEVIIVVHGLGANRKWMNGLAEYVQKETGTTVVNFGYPSTLAGVGEHAKSLESVLGHLDGVETVSFVAHSMGNLVIRYCLKNVEELPEAQRPPIQFKRFVMIAPPNHGASMADRFADSKLAQIAAGEPLQELAPGHGWEELEQHLATPDFEFAIIAGGVGDGGGYLAAIPGEDDGLLSLETNKLAGASDFAQVKGVHQLLPKNEQVQQYTVRFLLNGYLISEGARRPLGRVSARAADDVPR